MGEFRIPLDESDSGIMEYFEEAISFTVGDTTSIQENDESLGRKIAGWLYMITEKY